MTTQYPCMCFMYSVILINPKKKSYYYKKVRPFSKQPNGMWRLLQWIFYLFKFVWKIVKSDKSYMGYEVWLPSPPKVKKPRSVYNAASLAYIGDCIFEVSVEFYLKDIITLITD